jgi:RHS repeat-associated protein
VPRNEKPPYRFTGKELDGETGLYYYGARYRDPRAGRRLSADPAAGEYVPAAAAGRRGGVYNAVNLHLYHYAGNLHLYHYAGNNMVKYTGPDGRVDIHYLRKGLAIAWEGRLLVGIGSSMIKAG